jgi:predicted Zn-dependent peptidase
LEFLKHRLANGLEIVVERNAAAHSCALGFFVRAGSRDENDAVAGVSHFLEHMTFKGTPTRSAEDVNRQFDEIGAHYNAFTSEEATVYYASVLPEYQDPAVELLGDILRPSLRSDDFETEKQVILEEIHMYEDQPPFGADDKVKAAYYGAHPLGRSVLGTAESIRALTAEQMRDYHRCRYSPGNVVLVAAGRIDFERLLASAERWCGAWEPMVSTRIVEPAQPNNGFQLICKETATQQYVIQLAGGPSATDTDRYAAKVLGTILGDDSGSRLYWELVDLGLAEQVSLSHYEYEGAGAMMTYMSCPPEEAAGNLECIGNVYRAAETEGVTATELVQAKSKIASRIVLSSEKPRGRLFVVGTDWVQRGQYRSVVHDLDAVAALTLDDVHAVLARFPLTSNTTIVVGPLDSLNGGK